MGLVSRFNNVSPFSEVNTKGYQYVNLFDLYNKNGEKKVYHVKGLFINKKSKFGDTAIAIIDGCLANLPRHEVDTVKQMIDDDEIIQAIKDDKVGFKIRTYENGYSKQVNHETGEIVEREFYGIEWIDL